MRIEWSGGKLTKKRAAFLCWKMWEWIADDLTQEQWVGSSRLIEEIKRAWPGYSKVEKLVHDCAACQYVRQPDTFVLFAKCKKCFLIPAWGTFRGNAPCESNPESPYRRLHLLKTAKAVKRRARKIAEAARKVYEGCK